MPLEAPKLDTRNFEEIFAEARLRIPRYTPEWTDFNESDPGITLLQLFAWLSEMMLYQMNQVPERNYIKFLQLLGVELRPAQPALAHLVFTPQPGALVQPVLPRSQVMAQPPEGGDPLVFETEKGVDLVRLPLTDVQVSDGSTFTVVSEVNASPGTAYFPLGFVPQPGSALYFGFAQSDPPATGRLFPQQIRIRVFLPAEAQAGETQACADVQQAPPPPVELVWEYKASATPPQRWQRLAVFLDESAAFTREGYIQLEGPKEIAATVEGKIPDPRFWLRARLASGTYAAGRSPQIDFVRFNVAPAINLSTIREDVLGESEGVPDQFFLLRRKPVSPGTLELVVEIADQKPEQWTQVEDLLASGPDSPHFVLNANKGEVRFGDGRKGRIPPASAVIVARQYRFGGGTAGNVPAGLINSPQPPLIGVESVTNERAAEGGRNEQDVEELKVQAPMALRSRNRAVTTEDFTLLAGQAGGVAKATAVALANPNHPGVEVPGAVTVVVVPDNLDDPPRPSAELIEQVCRYLDRFRLVTTELYVKGPEYQKITVEARVAALPYASFDSVQQNVVAALNEYLHPKRWNFGEDLHPTNLFSVIRGVAGVAAVPRIFVLVNGQPHENLSEAVVMPRDGLVYGAGHEITVEPVTDR